MTEELGRRVTYSQLVNSKVWLIGGSLLNLTTHKYHSCNNSSLRLSDLTGGSPLSGLETYAKPMLQDQTAMPTSTIVSYNGQKLQWIRKGLPAP